MTLQGRFKPSRWTGLVIAIVVTSIAAPAQAAPGDPDTAFSGDGIVETTFGQTASRGSDEGDAIEAAPGGGYYVAGRTTGGQVIVLEYEAGGDLDTAFGGGDGIASIVQSSGSESLALAVDSSGRPVVAGGDQDGRFFAARFTTTGVLDTTFDGDGIATVDFGLDRGDEALAVTHFPDGRVALAGSSRLPGDDEDDVDFAVAVLGSGGSPDSAFGGGDGRVITDMGSPGDEARAIAVAPGDSLVVVGGGFIGGAPDNGDFQIAKYEDDGDLDVTFSGDGRLVIDLSGETSNSDFANAVEVSGSSVYVGGQAGSDCNSDTGLVKMSLTGDLDNTFSGDGKLVLDAPVSLGCSPDRAFDLEVDSAGRVVLGGSDGDQGSSGHFLVTRVTTAGVPDSTFDGDGFRQVDVADATDEAHGLVVGSPAGTITAAGTSNRADDTDRNVAVVRLSDAGGALDSSFGGDGIVEAEISFASDSSDAARSVVQQPDGKLLVAATTNAAPLDVNRGDFDFGVARYNADGSLDASFGGDGVASVNFTGGVGTPGSAEDVGGMALQPDGKVVLVGETAGDVGVARFESDGDLDVTFAPGGADGDGKRTVDLGGAYRDYASDALVQGAPGQSGFRIVVGASTANDVGSDARFALIGLGENGGTDAGFGDGGTGIVLTKVGPVGRADTLAAIAAQPDGKIVAAGMSFAFSPIGDFALARYSAAGVLDDTFDSDGKLLTDFEGANYDAARDVAVQDHGGGSVRIVAVGTGQSPSDQGPAVAAYTETGALDATFSPGGDEGDGRVRLDLFTGSPLTAVAIDASGRIYATGSMTNNSDRFGALRLTPAGVLDTTFGGDGVVNRTAFNSDGADLLLQSDGKLVVTGGDGFPQNGSDVLIDRYLTAADPVVNPPPNPPVQPPPADVGPDKPAKPKCKKGQKPKKVKGKVRCVRKKAKKKKK